jgi:Ca2+-binding RTX toxin-like protein
MFVQALESRRLMAGVTHTGTLVVEGTQGGDEINISRSSGTITVKLAKNDPAPQRFSVAAVKRILVLSIGGNDKVAIEHDIVEHATIVGGAGNDELVGNYGATLIGGSGTDYVPTRTQYDVQEDEVSAVPGAPAVAALLSGGIGDDNLVGDQDDMFVGGKGFDRAAASVHAVITPTFFGGSGKTFEVADIIDLAAVTASASGVEQVVGNVVDLDDPPLSFTSPSVPAAPVVRFSPTVQE